MQNKIVHNDKILDILFEEILKPEEEYKRKIYEHGTKEEKTIFINNSNCIFYYKQTTIIPAKILVVHTSTQHTFLIC